MMKLLTIVALVASIGGPVLGQTKNAKESIPYAKDSRYAQIKSAQKALTAIPAIRSNQTEVYTLASCLDFMEWCFINSEQQHIAVTDSDAVVVYNEKDVESYVRDTIITIPVPNTFETYIAYLFNKVTNKE